MLAFMTNHGPFTTKSTAAARTIAFHETPRGGDHYQDGLWSYTGVTKHHELPSNNLLYYVYNLICQKDVAPQ